MLDAYVRVSDVRGREGESFISPDVQREQIAAWIDAHGEEPGEVLVELDESGARADRPLLMEAIERIEAGHSEGLVVAKLDRFGRSLLNGLAAIGRIERAGGTFVSVQDGFDLGTPTGRLILRMMLAWAEWELERIRINGDIARERAVARGVYIPWKGPPGYLKGADGHLRPDAVGGRVIAEAFRRRARGERPKEIAEFLNRSELETYSGVPFEAYAIYRIIANRAYLGESRHGRHVNPSAHEPIVDEALWTRAQFQVRPRFESSRSLLARTARCATCGRSMASYAPSTKRSPSPAYRCYVMSQRRKSGGCPGPAAVSAEELEPLVEDFVIRRAAESDRGDADLDERWSRLTPTARRRKVAEILDCVVIERGREPIVERAWVCLSGKGPYPDGWNKLVQPFHRNQVEALSLPSPEIWPAERIETELRLFLRGGTQWPAYAGFAEAGLGRLHFQAMAYGGPYWWGPRMGIEIPAGIVLWNEERVRGALRPFLRARESFPTEGEFAQAGLGSLRTGLHNHGGLAYWADEFGLDSRSCGTRWTEAMIRKELEEILAGRRQFPTREEFRAAGKINLFYAAKRHGGIPHWRRRFDIRARTWSRHRPKPEVLPENELASRPELLP
ncbi:MAG TPA: recombinase family protein [Solirubrobacterales bacterium]